MNALDKIRKDLDDTIAQAEEWTTRDDFDPKDPGYVALREQADSLSNAYQEMASWQTRKATSNELGDSLRRTQGVVGHVVRNHRPGTDQRILAGRIRIDPERDNVGIVKERGKHGLDVGRAHDGARRSASVVSAEDNRVHDRLGKGTLSAVGGRVHNRSRGVKAARRAGRTKIVIGGQPSAQSA